MPAVLERRGVYAARYQDAVLSLPGLVSYWRLNEGGGTVLRDQRNANDCPINGVPVFGKEGVVDRGLTLPADQNINGLIAAPSLPTGSAARTMIGWIKTTAANGVAQTIVSYGAGATRQALGIKVNDASAALPNVGFWTFGSDFFFSATANNGFWHMLAVTVLDASTTAQMYFDGLPAAAASTLSGNLATSSTNLYIGRDAFSAGGAAVSGTIDELAISNVALSAGQIRDLYYAART